MAGPLTTLVREGFDAYWRGDVDAMLGIMDPAVEWVPATAVALGEEAFVGHDEVRRWMSERERTWETFEFTPERFYERDPFVVGIGRIHAKGRGSGVELDSDISWLFEVRNGKCVRLRSWFDRETALREAGIAAPDG